MPTPARSSIFRRVSLERLSSPEQLDTMMRATDPQGWLALVTIGLLLLAAVAWSLFATIPNKVTGKGILLRGRSMQEIFALSDGVLAEVFVKAGEEVQMGQKMALIYDTESYRQIQQSYATIQNLGTALQTAPANQRAILSARLRTARTQLAQAQAAVQTRGLLLSPAHARVVEIIGEKLDLITAGSHVFYIEPVDKPLQALIYVASSDAGRIAKGMTVQIYPDNTPREEYGCLLGRVESVGLYPSSFADLHRKYGNDQLVAALLSGRTPVEVTVTLNEDRSTPSGYEWSSHMGPNYVIRGGTLCDAAVIIGQQHPIRLVLP